MLALRIFLLVCALGLLAGGLAVGPLTDLGLCRIAFAVYVLGDVIFGREWREWPS